jgi:RHS repeat-associated protein
MTPAGDVGSITEGGSARTYQYDFLDRLTGLDGLESYVHDPNGNRTSERSSGGWSGYLLAGDRVTAIKVPYSYAGCYTDQSTRALPVLLASGGATAKSCTEAARAQGLKYAGLQYYGYCFGGNTLGYAKAGDGECNTQCTANPAEPCGGSYRNTVYSVLGNSEPWAFAYDRQSNVSALAMAPSAPVTTYQGCYADEGMRALPVQLMSSGATVAKCAAAALAQGLKYAGLQYFGYCFGGNTLQYAKVADSECNTRCSANSAEWCGGSWRNSIYEAVRWTESAAMCLRHDPLGRLVLVGSTSPSSVTADGLACTTDAAVTGAAARFKYDFRNRRIASWRATTNEWVYTVFDQAGQPLAELAKTSDPVNPWRPVREYVWLDGRPIAQIEYDAVTGISRSYSVHTDAIGMPRALTSPGGATVWTASVARPYGDITETTTPDPETGKTVVTNLRLPGQYDERMLGTLGLQGPYYNWNRWYLPSAGRYLELDPVAKKGGFNGRWGPEWYTYADGNPLRHTDPRGLAIWICNRKTDFGIGNHAYLWNDMTGGACGMRNSSGGGGETGPNDRGPGVDDCRRVADSDGQEDGVMQCCQQTDFGVWVPGVNDCHDAANTCLVNSGLTNPGAPGGRFGDPCDPCTPSPPKK